MPLYFFLSGLFFKTYGSFWSFVKKKTNKLLIPFVFFYLTLSVFLSVFLFRTFNIKIQYAVNFDTWSVLTEFVTRENFPNSPIWFLLSLYEISIFFFVCYKVAECWSKYKLVLLIGFSLLIGFTGLALSRYQINLPMFIDSSMTSLPFFMMGYVIKDYTSILYQDKNDKYSICVIIVCFVLAYFLASKGVSYKQNNFKALGIIKIYLSGFLGSMGIILIAKLLKRLPFVSYWGRYSIMILVTHRVIYQIYAPLISSFFGRVNFGIVVVNLILTMMTYQILIPFMCKYLPHVTAQKDIIK